jgi:hypothetical protein
VSCGGGGGAGGGGSGGLVGGGGGGAGFGSGCWVAVWLVGGGGLVGVAVVLALDLVVGLRFWLWGGGVVGGCGVIGVVSLSCLSPLGSAQVLSLRRPTARCGGQHGPVNGPAQPHTISLDLQLRLKLEVSFSHCKLFA